MRVLAAHYCFLVRARRKENGDSSGPRTDGFPLPYETISQESDAWENQDYEAGHGGQYGLLLMLLEIYPDLAVSAGKCRNGGSGVATSSSAVNVSVNSVGLSSYLGLRCFNRGYLPFS